jgi:hypothetical protein
MIEKTDYKNITLKNRDGEDVPLAAIIAGVIETMNKPEFVTKSKGHKVVGNFIEILMQKDDPFIRSLAVIGGELSINSIGILLFIAFQLGVLFGNSSYQLADDADLKESDKSVAES